MFCSEESARLYTEILFVGIVRITIISSLLKILSNAYIIAFMEHFINEYSKILVKAFSERLHTIERRVKMTVLSFHYKVWDQITYPFPK